MERVGRGGGERKIGKRDIRDIFLSRRIFSFFFPVGRKAESGKLRQTAWRKIDLTCGHESSNFHEYSSRSLKQRFEIRPRRKCFSFLVEIAREFPTSPLDKLDLFFEWLNYTSTFIIIFGKNGESKIVFRNLERRRKRFSSSRRLDYWIGL